MINTEITSSKISFTISYAKDLVNHVLAMSEHFVEQNCPLTNRDIDIILRELLNNAIEHGRVNDGDGSILCSIELVSTDRAVIIVEDNGEGFDYRGLDLSLPLDGSKVRHRGLILVNALSERMEFNDKGNAVSVFLSLKEK